MFHSTMVRTDIPYHSPTVVRRRSRAKAALTVTAYPNALAPPRLIAAICLNTRSGGAPTPAARSRWGGVRVHSGQMRIRHLGMALSVHPEAYVAPTAVLSGDVRVGPGRKGCM